MNIQHEIDALQAEKTFGTLLDCVEAGDEVVITRRGKAAARLVTARMLPASINVAAEAAARIRGRAKTATDARMSWSDWPSLRDEERW
jgi:prevent-host-death family protein